MARNYAGTRSGASAPSRVPNDLAPTADDGSAILGEDAIRHRPRVRTARNGVSSATAAGATGAAGAACDRRHAADEDPRSLDRGEPRSDAVRAAVAAAAIAAAALPAAAAQTAALPSAGTVTQPAAAALSATTTAAAAVPAAVSAAISAAGAVSAARTAVWLDLPAPAAAPARPAAPERRGDS